MTTSIRSPLDEPDSRDAGGGAERITERRFLPDLPGRPDCVPKAFIVPDRWNVTRHGVTKNVKRRDTVERVTVTYGPVIPVATHTDPDGDQLVELVWFDGRRWVNRLVPRSIAKSGKRLVAALGDAGFPATEANGKDVEAWLAEAEQLNCTLLPDRRIARWLGWQTDGQFLSTHVDDRVEVAFPEQKAALAAHRPSGTLTAWQAGVAHIEPLPAAKVGLYAGLAASLLRVVGVDSFVIDFSGRSTRGKTTAAKIGLSCWADPSEKGDGTFSWRTTTLAIEKRLNLVRGMAVLLDETRVVTKPEMIDEILYQVSKNHGKARGAGWPNLLPWETIVLSTGEQPALSFTTHQGASARVLGITRPPFGAGGPKSAEAALAVGRAVDENYGLAGPLFAGRLVEMLELDEGRTKVIARHRELAHALTGKSDLSARRAPLVATLVLAAELAERWGIIPGVTKPKLATWLELFTAEDATDNRPEMALDAVREFIAANASALWEPGATRAAPPGGWIGRTVHVSGEPVAVALLPTRLKEALSRHGIVLETVLPAWKDNNWLVRGSEKDRPWDPKKRLGSTNVRLLTFAPAAVDFSAARQIPQGNGNSPYIDEES